jgi:hypothetical protein
MAIKINSKLVMGVARFNHDLFVLLPNLYMQTQWNDSFSERHYFTIEFRVMYFGIGIKVSWKNKDIKPLPDNIY